MKKVIAVCMGSSCFARRNTELINLIKDFLQEKQLNNKVELKGSLCMDQCKNGPNIRIDDKIFHEMDSVKLIKILNEELI